MIRRCTTCERFTFDSEAIGRQVLPLSPERCNWNRPMLPNPDQASPGHVIFAERLPGVALDSGTTTDVLVVLPDDVEGAPPVVGGVPPEVDVVAPVVGVLPVVADVPPEVVLDAPVLLELGVDVVVVVVPPKVGL